MGWNTTSTHEFVFLSTEMMGMILILSYQSQKTKVANSCVKYLSNCAHVAKPLLLLHLQDILQEPGPIPEA